MAEDTKKPETTPPVAAAPAPAAAPATVVAAPAPAAPAVTVVAAPAPLPPILAAKKALDAAGRPPIEIGERRFLAPAFGRLQNPTTQQWFNDVPVKADVDMWVLGQYYADPARLNLGEE